MGPQRRTISGADSVDSSAKVISAGQLGSFAPAGAASAAARTATSTALSIFLMDSSSDGRPPDAGRDAVDAHHHDDDEQDHCGRLPVVERANRVPQVEADAAAADHADD